MAGSQRGLQVLACALAISGSAEPSWTRPGAPERYGIHSFTYARRRPFAAGRLTALLGTWPEITANTFSVQALSGDAFGAILRSRGWRKTGNS